MGRTLKYNIEVRMYSWANLFVFLAFIMLYEVISSEKMKNYLLFMIFSVIAAYLHIFALLAVVFLYLGLWIWVIISKDKDKCIKMGIVSIGAVVLYSPWISTFLKTFMRVSGNFWITTIPDFKECYQFIFGYIATLPVVLIGLIIFFLYECKIVVINENRNTTFPCIDIKVNKNGGFSNIAIFVLIGIITVSMAYITGTAVSYVIRPVFVARYLFPITAIAYMVFGIIVSKMKFRRIYCIGVTIVVLIAGLIVYTKIYRDDKAVDNATKQFIENVDLGESDYVITDVWNVVDYYYPDTANSRLDGAKIDFSKCGDKNIWILWTSLFNEDMNNEINEMGYNAELYYEGILGEPYTVFLYRIVRK